MEPFRKISLVETGLTKCHLTQTPAGFNLSYEQIFPLNRDGIHSLIYFLEKVQAEQRLPRAYAHGHLFLIYAPEESANEMTISYENRRITMDLTTAFLLLDSLQDRGPGN